MGLIIAVVLTTAVTLTQLQHGEANVVDGNNAKHFGVLCDIYNMATNPPHLWSVEPTVKAIRAGIDTINASISDDLWFEEVRTTDSLGKLSEKFNTQNNEISKYWGRWKEAVAAVEKREDLEKLSSSAPAVRVGQAKLRKIEQQLDKVLTEMQLNNSGTAESIKRKFEEAIYGEGNVDKGDDNADLYKGSSDRKTTCGTPNASTGAAGAKAGFSLIMDFLCLCAYKGSGLQKACGDDVDVTTSNAWDGATNGSNGKENWQKLKGFCTKRPHAEKFTAERGLALLQAFESMVTVGGLVDTDDMEPGVFGTCHGDCKSSTGCNGVATSGNGICVYYGKDHVKWKEIKWLQKMKGGLKELNQTESDLAATQHNIAYLKMLLTRAEEIYEETKATLELEKSNPETLTQKQNQSQNPSTSTIKGASQEPTSVSAAAIRRFILPWTLLI